MPRQFTLANDYFRARYVTLDYAEMLTLYRRSATQGFAPAQNKLGSMYENNIGLPQDYKRAATYYRLAANQGFAPAQYNLAALFERGRGVCRDYKHALSWYRKAADQGPSAAEKEIGYTSADSGSSVIMPRPWPDIAAPQNTATPTPKTS